jgi:hypothetical protein
MGMLKEIKLSHEKPTFCCLESDSPDAGCCDGETEFSSLDEDYTVASLQKIPQADWFFVLPVFHALDLITPSFENHVHPGAHAPPGSSTPRFIFHCVFLI